MNSLAINFPNKVVFGSGCSDQFVGDFKTLGFKHLLIVTAPPILKMLDPLINKLKSNGTELFVYDNIDAEPAIEDLNDLLDFSKEKHIDSVLGIGGGSVLDLAKLVAAMIYSDQSIDDIFGIGNLNNREIYLACIPTTSGTGSEVSPNAILLDKRDNLKKGVVSPFLVPDGAYVDPMYTLSVPPSITAATGLDALVHCIEEYTNLYSHPIIDLYAKEGINLISHNLKRAFEDGNDIGAREKVALGSLYGGIGLGPVNTAAVHALSYPLGGTFHIPHGLSNAVLLPYVMKFNLEAAPKKYADVAFALGAEKGKDDLESASNGVEKIFELCEKLNVEVKLSAIKIPKDALDELAIGAIKVERLLKNNPRKISLEDIKQIYNQAY